MRFFSFLLCSFSPFLAASLNGEWKVGSMEQAARSSANPGVKPENGMHNDKSQHLIILVD